MTIDQKQHDSQAIIFNYQQGPTKLYVIDHWTRPTEVTYCIHRPLLRDIVRAEEGGELPIFLRFSLCCNWDKVKEEYYDTEG